jgi:hypothetical protein
MTLTKVFKSPKAYKIYKSQIIRHCKVLPFVSLFIQLPYKHLDCLVLLVNDISSY